MKVTREMVASKGIGFAQFFLFFLGISILIYTAAEAKEHKTPKNFKEGVLVSKQMILPTAECFCFDSDLKPSFAAIRLPSMEASAEIECLKYGNAKQMQCEYDPNLSAGYVSLEDAPGF